MELGRGVQTNLLGGCEASQQQNSERRISVDRLPCRAILLSAGPRCPSGGSPCPSTRRKRAVEEDKEEVEEDEER